LSILAEVVASVRSGAGRPVPADGGAPVSGTVPVEEAAPVDGVAPVDGTASDWAGGGPRETEDPVCGMTVTVVAGTPHLAVGGVSGGEGVADVWFCGTGCRDRYAAEHAG
jgi:xanthine dehydrogenase accessory factor